MLQGEAQNLCASKREAGSKMTKHDMDTGSAPEEADVSDCLLLLSRNKLTSLFAFCVTCTRVRLSLLIFITVSLSVCSHHMIFVCVHGVCTSCPLGVQLVMVSKTAHSLSVLMLHTDNTAFM